MRERGRVAGAAGLTLAALVAVAGLAHAPRCSAAALGAARSASAGARGFFKRGSVDARSVAQNSVRAHAHQREDELGRQSEPAGGHGDDQGWDLTHSHGVLVLSDGEASCSEGPRGEAFAGLVRCKLRATVVGAAAVRVGGAHRPAEARTAVSAPVGSTVAERNAYEVQRVNATEAVHAARAGAPGGALAQARVSLAYARAANSSRWEETMLWVEDVGVDEENGAGDGSGMASVVLDARVNGLAAAPAPIFARGYLVLGVDKQMLPGDTLAWCAAPPAGAGSAATACCQRLRDRAAKTCQRPRAVAR